MNMFGVQLNPGSIKIKTPSVFLSFSLQCVVAVQSALCLKAAMRRVVVCVNQSFRVLDVNSANLDSTPTPTVKVHTHTETHTHKEKKVIKCMCYF